MSHSINTESLYYQAIVGEQHAVSAFSTMSSLRTGKGLEETPVTAKDGEVPSTPKSAQSIDTSSSLRTRTGREETSGTRKDGEGPLTPRSISAIQTCRPFTAEETEIISKYFEEAIEAGVRVSLVQCKRLLGAK